MRARSVKRVINRTCSESVSSEAQCAAEGRRTARGGASQDRMEGSGGFPCACTAAGRMGRRDRLLKPPAARNGKMEIMYRSEEHTSELQSLMRISYDVFCLKKKTKIN